MYKTCSRCHQTKDISNFHKNKHLPDGYTHNCKQCVKIIQSSPEWKKTKAEYDKTYHKEYTLKLTEEDRQKRREKENKRYQSQQSYKRDYFLQQYYGITLMDYQEILNKQNGRCEICGILQSDYPRRFAVDHNHETGKIRGLLCHNCNVSLGKFKDGALLQKAMDYIKKYNGENSDDSK